MLGDDWKKSGAGETWNLEEAKEGDTFFGVYLDTEENVGPNSSKLHNFVRYEDEQFTKRIGEYSIWGTTMLDTRFKNFTRGEQVAVVYLGKAQSEKRRGATYHNFEIYHRPPEKRVKIEEPTGDWDNVSVEDMVEEFMTE